MSRLPQLIANAKREGWAEWIRSEADEHAVLNGCRFNADKGERTCKFFTKWLRHSKGRRWKGKPFAMSAEAARGEPPKGSENDAAAIEYAERCAPLIRIQREQIIMPLFGWERSDSFRRYRRAYISAPKKNFKSTLCSGLSAYMLLGDREDGAEVYTAAATRQQATIVYREAANMVEASPGLAKHVHVRRGSKTMWVPATKSLYMALAADAGSVEGPNISCLIFDELHTQKTRDLWDSLRYGGDNRDQPLLISITTAGYDRNSVCYEQCQQARAILDGSRKDLSFFPFLLEVPEEADWQDPEEHKRVNPGLGITVNREAFQEALEEAQQSAQAENAFRRRKLNQWTKQSVRWLKTGEWAACKGTVDAKALEGRQCYGGLDLAQVSDANVLALLFPGDDGVYDVLPFFWMPVEPAEERQRQTSVPYLDWIRDGWIIGTDGWIADYSFMRRDISGVMPGTMTLTGEALVDRYAIQEIGIDRLFQGAQLMTDLGSDGIECVSLGQGFMSMAAPTKSLKELILSRKIRHGGHPVLDWMMDNAAVRTDPAGNWKPDKAESEGKIDGVVATIMALSRAQVHEEAGSVYDRRDPVTV